jgi:outer membrane receptor protein involved in Fe transport
MTDRGLTLAAAISMVLWAAQLGAQERSQEPSTEEVVVTGSYIKQNRFDAPSPVEVIDSEVLLQSGEPNLGEYIRDLTFTANTDTVANVLAVQDGGQDSTTARFNLRGLGTGSTLTLFDGRRTVEQGAIGSLAPELALERVEVVLDGGAALYGTDAVAGVVNLIPIKKFNGTKARVYYTQDQDGDTHEPKYSLLWGKGAGAWNFVSALDYSKRSPLRRTDRPRFLRADDDDSNLGSPGQFTRVTTPTGALFNDSGAPRYTDLPSVNIPASATAPARRREMFMIDPGCGQFNDGATDDGLGGSFPSGRNDLPPSALLGQACGLEFGEFQDYLRASEELDSYSNVLWDFNDKVSFELQVSATMRTSELISSPSLGNSNNNRLLFIPVSNPGNPTRGTLDPTAVRASTFSFRPFGKSGTLPTHLDDQGATHTDFTTISDRYKLGSKYQFGDSSWSGETFLSIQTTRTDVDQRILVLDRLQAALQGRGGPNGNEFFNPTASADPRSSMFVADGPNQTANSQALIDSLFERERYEATRTRLTFVESIVTGDLFKLPAGDLAVAAGVQARNTTFKTRPNSFEAARNDYDNAIVTAAGLLIPADAPRRLESQVNAAFAELQVPIVDKVTLQAAVRYEDFRDLDLNATTPKFAVRYEPFNSLSLRASYSEGFLAPGIAQVQPVFDRDCAEVFTGSDPFTLVPNLNPATRTTMPFVPVSLAGTRSCESGNPGLQAEESETINVGLTWKPLDSLEISLDYQMIDYTDRIQTLTSQDLVNRDFGRLLAQNGLSPAQFNGTIVNGMPVAGALTADQRTALITGFFATNPDPLISRDPANMRVVQVTRTPANITGNEVDVFDLRVRYGFDIGNLGYISTSASTTFYDKYEYTDLDGRSQVDALGKRNADTALAPPLPEFKHSLNVAWLKGNQRASVAVKYTDSVLFDGTPDTTPGAIPFPRTISSFTTVDVRYSIDIDNFLSGKWNLSIGANNVLNEQADALPISGGFESRLQDPFGRAFYVEANYEL